MIDDAVFSSLAYTSLQHLTWFHHIPEGVFGFAMRPDVAYSHKCLSSFHDP